jgi:hypothetical protein
MHNALRANLAAAAEAFAAELVASLRNMPLDELLETMGEGAAKASTSSRPSPKRAAPAATSAPAARGRRAPEDLERITDLIVKLLRGHPKGMRTEEIRAALGLRREDVVRPIATALEAKKITKKGQKRATTYFAK